MAGILKKLDEEPEQLRWLVLGYMSSVLLSGGPKASKAYRVIRIFEGNFYDSKHAGLRAACWEVVTGEEA